MGPDSHDLAVFDVHGGDFPTLSKGALAKGLKHRLVCDSGTNVGLSFCHCEASPSNRFQQDSRIQVATPEMNRPDVTIPRNTYQVREYHRISGHWEVLHPWRKQVRKARAHMCWVYGLSAIERHTIAGGALVPVKLARLPLLMTCWPPYLDDRPSCNDSRSLPVWTRTAGPAKIKS